VGCRATVYIPVNEGNEIMENGKPVAESTDVKNLGKEDGYQAFSVNGGDYSFVVE
jgi:alpha-L-rhamnosidase